MDSRENSRREILKKFESYNASDNNIIRPEFKENSYQMEKYDSYIENNSKENKYSKILNREIYEKNKEPAKFSPEERMLLADLAELIRWLADLMAVRRLEASFAPILPEHSYQGNPLTDTVGDRADLLWTVPLDRKSTR